MNQTPKDSPQANVYKKGDIVWVLYRGKEFYPARVNAFYPKERKISHVWFPLNRKSIGAIFKADMGKVRPFTLEDSLPDNASQELEYSYDQAVRILQGTSIEEILEENDRMMEEMGVPVQKQKSSTKKSLNTSDISRKHVTSPKSTPKQHKTPRGAATVYQQPPELEPPEALFTPGDPIIVDTSIGMWPGIFHSYAEGVAPESDDIRYTLFPRDPSSDILAGKKSSIVHFPLAHIEQSINEGIGSEMLMEALRDALQYVKVRNAQQEAASASKHLGISSQNEQFLKTLPTPSDIKNTPMVSEQATSAPTKTPKSIPKKKSIVPAQKMAPRAKELKKELVFKHEEESSNSLNIDDTTTAMTPPVAVTPKNKSFFSDKRFRLSSTSSVEVASPYQPPSEKKAKSSNNDEHESSLTEEEKQQQLELFPQKETPTRESAGGGTSSSSTITTYKQITKKPTNNGHHITRRSPVKTTNDLPPTFQNDSEPMDFEPQKSKSTSPQKQLIATNFGGKPSLFELASSEDAHKHMQQIWGECDEAWFKEMLNAEFLQLDFRSGGLLTFKETEKLILEIEKWIKMEDITPMSHFREHFYIAKYVLPELCTYALSKMKDISMMDARRIYEERREKTKHQTGLNSSSPNSLDTLVMAANMKMAEEQNGGINEGK
ncbi:hypothetical protein ACQ4LE_008444 [Meloidogyne hapla]